MEDFLDYIPDIIQVMTLLVTAAARLMLYIIDLERVIKGE